MLHRDAVLFVCNKWTIVSDKDKPAALARIMEDARTCWSPEITPDKFVTIDSKVAFDRFLPLFLLEGFIFRFESQFSSFLFFICPYSEAGKVNVAKRRNQLLSRRLLCFCWSRRSTISCYLCGGD